MDQLGTQAPAALSILRLGDAGAVSSAAAAQPRQEQTEQAQESHQSAVLRKDGVPSRSLAQLSRADGVVYAERRGEVHPSGDGGPVQPRTRLPGRPRLRSAKAAVAQRTLDSRGVER